MPISNKEDQDHIVFLHNEARRKVANGKLKAKHGKMFPKASNMQVMTWNDDLAQTAQHWINQCLFQNDENEHRIIHPFEMVEQNMHKTISRRNLKNRCGSYQKSIKSWLAEAKDLSSSNILLQSFKSNLL